MSWCAQETPAPARVYVKRTELQGVAADILWSAACDSPEPTQHKRRNEHVKKSRNDPKMAKHLKSLAGAGGFEPPHGGTKIRCLTAWLRPIDGCVLRATAWAFKAGRPGEAQPSSKRKTAKTARLAGAGACQGRRYTGISRFWCARPTPA